MLLFIRKHLLTRGDVAQHIPQPLVHVYIIEVAGPRSINSHASESVLDTPDHPLQEVSTLVEGTGLERAMGGRDVDPPHIPPTVLLRLHKHGYNRGDIYKFII